MFPFTMRTHDNVWSLNEEFNHDINTTTSFVRIDFHIQDWAKFVFERIYPLGRDDFRFRSCV